VNVEHLVAQLTKPQQMNNIYVAALVYKRLLKPDCLHNGWVLMGYPNTVADLEILYKMIAPPNKYDQKSWKF
jgi:adenylate kinase family enzyme